MQGSKAAAGGSKGRDAGKKKRSLLEEFRQINRQKMEIVERMLSRFEEQRNPVPGALAGPTPAAPALAPSKRPAYEQHMDGPNAKRPRLSAERNARLISLMRECKKHLQSLKNNRDATHFNSPVDPRKVQDYDRYIKNPMDLGTISKKIEKGLYSSPLEFASDVRLVWSNCRTFNGLDSWITKLADKLSGIFEKWWSTNQIEARWKETAGMQEEEAKPRGGPPAEEVAADMAERVKVLDKRLQNSISKSGKKATDRSQMMCFEDKRRLSIELGSLPHDKLPPVLEIAQSAVTMEGEEEDEVELDIDKLPDAVLWKLKDYLDSLSNVPPKKGGSSRPQNPGKEGRAPPLEQGVGGNSGDLRGHTRPREQGAGSPSETASGCDEEGEVGSTKLGEHEQKHMNGTHLNGDGMAQSSRTPVANGIIKTKPQGGTKVQAPNWNIENIQTDGNPESKEEEDDLFREFEERQKKENERKRQQEQADRERREKEEQRRKKMEEEQERQRKEKEEQDRLLKELEKEQLEEKRRQVEQRKKQVQADMDMRAGRDKINDHGAFQDDLEILQRGGETDVQEVLRNRGFVRKEDEGYYDDI